jgi:NDP-sugar pyrophosphorylase family protein
MRAMILTAGFGSRLRPLTDQTPKALLKIEGTPILEIVIRRLVSAGASAIIINVHHFANQIEEFLKNRDFGIPIETSFEKEILETGGGLKNVESFFKEGLPFILHNADVLSDLNLKAFYQFHLDHPALASLSTRKRPSSRALLFSPQGQLCGVKGDGPIRWVEKPIPDAEALAFDGIHVLSPEIFPKIKETGKFSIIETYLRLAKEGEKIQSFRSDHFSWVDIGSFENLEKARNLPSLWRPKL